MWKQLEPLANNNTFESLLSKTLHTAIRMIPPSRNEQMANIVEKSFLYIPLQLLDWQLSEKTLNSMICSYVLLKQVLSLLLVVWVLPGLLWAFQLASLTVMGQVF